jgi:hypothetical protein
MVTRSGHLIGFGMCAITFFVGRFVQNPSCSSCSPWQCDSELFFVRKPNSSGGLSYIPAHNSPNKVVRSGHLIGAHTHQALTTRRLVPYIVRDGQWQCGIGPTAPSMAHPARRGVPNGPAGRKLQHFKCMSKARASSRPSDDVGCSTAANTKGGLWS